MIAVASTASSTIKSELELHYGAFVLQATVSLVFLMGRNSIQTIKTEIHTNEIHSAKAAASLHIHFERINHQCDYLYAILAQNNQTGCVSCSIWRKQTVCVSVGVLCVVEGGLQAAMK